MWMVAMDNLCVTIIFSSGQPQELRLTHDFDDFQEDIKRQIRSPRQYISIYNIILVKKFVKSLSVRVDE